VLISRSDSITVQWWREDGESRLVPTERRIERRDFGLRLQIGDLKRSVDEGNYSCVGSNNAGQAKLNIKLFVHCV